MCHISVTQIKTDGQVLANALTQLSNVPGEPANIKAALVAAASLLVSVTSNWTTGSAMTDFNTAMSAVTAAMALIPATAPYALFVGIVQDAIDMLWANFNTVQTPTKLSLSLAKSVTDRLKSIYTEAPSHWHGKSDIKHHFGESYRDSFAHAWDEGVTAHPEFGFTKL